MAEEQSKSTHKNGKSFKRHGAFSKKDRRSDSFRGSRQSAVDPRKSIVDHHGAHKARIGRIIAVCAGLILAVLFTFRGFEQWGRRNERLEKIEQITLKVSELENQMSEQAGYQKSLSALQAIVRLNRALRIEPEQTSSFKRKIDGFVAVLEESGVRKGENYVNPQTLIDFVQIPQGNFLMGRKTYELGDHDELPQRNVTIPYEFWMAKTETTNLQLRRLFPNHRLDTWKRHHLDLDSQPAVKIDWNTATIFCRMMNIDAAKKKSLPEGYEYRLPTEAEWEYACRAGTATRYYWGNDFAVAGSGFANSLDKKSSKILDWGSSRQAAPYDKYLVAAPVASLEPNAFGLYDMNGNVWEWCWDWYNSKAYTVLPDVNPVQVDPVETELQKRKPFDSGYYSVTTTTKVIRGGSWGNLPADCRSSNREFVEPSLKTDTGIGFRIVLAPKIVKK